MGTTQNMCQVKPSARKDQPTSSNFPKICQPAPDPLIQKRNDQLKNGKTNIKIDTLEKEKEALQNSVCSLCMIPYEEQLKQKMSTAKQVLNRLGIELNKNECLRKWLAVQRDKFDGLPCKLHEIQCVRDFCENYRNKCEFTIAKNELSRQRTVGFRIGSYVKGSLSVVSVEGINTIPDRMVQAAKVFEKFVQNSQYEVYSPVSITGYWKILTVRLGVRTDQLMLIIGFDPQELNEENITSLKDEIKKFFSSEEGASLNVTSLYFRLMPRSVKGQENIPPELLLGEPYIEEILCSIKFKISPQSFFQINTPCSELLIKSMKDLAKVNKDTVVLDVCCGTGTLGLCLANDCKQVLGIEIGEQAVNDARENAERNNIKNCEFFCGKADEIFSSVAHRVKDENLVAIVDPPRAGLQRNAIYMLRKTKNLKRFVYLACDVKSALNNFTELGRAPSKMMVGDPFVPVAAIPVDMFPQTTHCELVIYFERLHLEEFENYKENSSLG